MKKNNKKGFTLLEVLVSIIIVGIVLTCVVILTNASTEASSKSRLNNNISFKIEGILDEFSVDPTSVREGRIYYDELFTTKTVSSRKSVPLTHPNKIIEPAFKFFITTLR